MNKLLLASTVVFFAACASPEGTGLMLTPAGTGALVRFDAFHKPLPEVPLPNDFATRFDPTSPTRRRINASLEGPTDWEKATREAIDQLDGWGPYQSITVGFEKPLDVKNIISRHQGDDYDPRDDAVYLIDITPDSPDYCRNVPLDMGEGNFPITLERPNYFPNDFHNDGEQLLFEDREEDLNGNGKLDLGEDLDMDGVLDHPNTLYPGASGFDVLNFYERETDTLIMKPVMPLRETTTYAVVLTRRLVDEDGRPVRSPFAYVNHTSQTKALTPLEPCLPRYGMGLEDVAFTWPYTTMSVTRDMKVVRDGLYAQGVLKRLAEEYPAQMEQLYKINKTGSVNMRIVDGDEFRTVAEEVLKAQSGGSIGPAYQEVIDSHKFIDFHVVFSFESPQLFPREDSEGKPLPLYKQIWNLDPLTGATFSRSEKVTVWLTVPKNRTGPAPVVILGHGYTGNKLDPLFYGGFLARYGVATIGMENVSHGIGLDSTDVELARGLFGSKGYEGFFNAIVNNHRALDQDGDGIADSGADFWTSYIFHTRDVVRQSAVDYLQLVRLLRGFNGINTTRFGLKADGTDLAGDFDGDGVVDVGGNAAINIMGGSLGGIMSGMMAGVEPQLSVSVPVSGGAGLPDIGIRSIQGGVGEAVNLRMFGPLLLTLKNSEGGLDVWQYLPHLNGLGKVKLAAVPSSVTLAEGDTVVLTNLRSGEHRCNRVQPDGLLRVAVSSDMDDELKLEVFAGPLPPEERTGCSIPEAAVARYTLEKTTYDFEWAALVACPGGKCPISKKDGAFEWGRKQHEAGEPLTALGDGFGLRRQSPELRRFIGLAQLSIDKGDPVNWVPYAEHWNLHYGTGETVKTRMLVFNTIGDMNVPVATGVALARAAGMIDLTTKDPRFGKTPNRVLIDNGVIEAVERTGRFQDSQGKNVLMDIEHFSAIPGVDDGFDVPRLDPPLRLVKKSENVGGMTGVLFPMVNPTGRHGFDTPDPSLAFDLGSFLMNMVGRYVQTGGEELPMEACQENSSCSWVPPIPN